MPTTGEDSEQLELMPITGGGGRQNGITAFL